MTRRAFALFALVAGMTCLLELRWFFAGQTADLPRVLPWAISPAVAILFFVAGWPLALRDSARKVGEPWNPRWLDHFLGRASWPLALAVLSFAIALCGGALFALSSYAPGSPGMIAGYCIAATGVMLGHVSVLAGFVSWLLPPASPSAASPPAA